MSSDLKNSKNYVFSEKDAKDGMVIISKYLPKNSLYLHSAIISIENGIPYIYDNDPDNPINKQGGSVRRIALKDYLKVNKVIEYYDTKLTSEQIKERVKKYLPLKFSWLNFNCETFIEKVTQKNIKRSSFHPIQKLAIGLTAGALILAKKGGELSKTPASKSERIYGSELNKPKSAESSSKASSIVLGESTINSIKSILDKHNDIYTTKKIPLSVGKAVVRRGMGAYSSTHRPTISEGKPNSRVAWGLARLNAFVYKIQKGHSKSGKYTQDDDLIKELGIMVKKYKDGGTMQSSVEIQFELDEAKDLNTLENNIKHILKEYSNKKMATHQVIKYLNEKKISRDWLASKKINSKDELEKYLNNLQNKVRSGVKERKKQEAKIARQELILSEIERLAHEQNYEMQKKIDNKYKIGGSIENNCHYTIGGL